MAGDYSDRELGTADYPGLSGSVTFGANSPSPQLVTIDGYHDSFPEPSETFRVVLSNPTGGAMLRKSIGVGTIVNDD
ncbi:MAG: hypothetical protein EXR51_12035 [Dehalococcoidia bacterium]|nr:hypothetical protein [Dehalococcoidia bacterium]